MAGGSDIFDEYYGPGSISTGDVNQRIKSDDVARYWGGNDRPDPLAFRERSDKPQAELRNTYRPSDGGAYLGPAIQGVTENLWAAPFTLGQTIGTGYNQARAADYPGLAETVGMTAAGALIPGAPKGRKGKTPAAPGAELPMDWASKEARAKQMGALPDTYYHGTTHDFTHVADPATHPVYEKESHHGPAFYMTSDRGDAMQNYQGVGPDLSNRIERLAEQYVHDLDTPEARLAIAHKIHNKDALAEDGTMPEYWARAPESKAAWAQAYNELVGANEDGRVLALRAMPQNPVYVGGPKDTVFPYESFPSYYVDEKKGKFVVMDPETNKPVRQGRFDTEAEAYDHIDYLTEGEMPKGSGAQLLDYLAQLPYDKAKELADSLREHAHEDQGIKASFLERQLRNHDLAMYLSDDGSSPGQLLQDMYRHGGYDAAILHDAGKQFPRMGIGPDTEHIALFDPRRVRSVDAKFDPAKKDSNDLMAGIAGAAAIPTTAQILDKYYGEDDGRD